jgi:Tol biopolymer transport system component
MMTITPVRAFITLLLASSMPSAPAAEMPPESWIKAGNEKQIVRDDATWTDATGREIRYLTSAEYQNGIFHPCCQSWSKDNRHIWFTSTRPRPDGTHIEGEAQLMAADTRTGDLYWLATLPGENTSRNRWNPHHADYNSRKNTIIFTDMDDKNLHALQLDTGAVTHLWKMDDGHLGHPFSISADGRRLAFPARIEGQGAIFCFKSPAHAVFYLELDETGTKAAGMPRMIISHPARKISGTNEPLHGNIKITHIQLNPADRDLLSYCEGPCAPSDAQIRTVRADGSDARNLLPAFAGRAPSHALWGPDGKWLYFTDTGSIARISINGETVEPLSGHHKLRAMHLSISDDRNRIAYDLYNTDGLKDADGNVTRGEIWWFDVETKTPIKLANAAWNERTRMYARPKIAPDGSAVIFNVAEGKGSRVAFMLLPAPGRESQPRSRSTNATR